MTNRLRNIFDQYSQLENRVTHALAHALVSERFLARDFLQWATGHHSVGDPLIVVQDRKGGGDSIPDMTLRDTAGYLCVVENKLRPDTVTTEQLTSHSERVRPVDQQGGSILVITPDSAEPSKVQEVRLTGVDVYWCTWQAVYEWIMAKASHRPGAVLPRSFCQYLRQAEGELQAEGVDVMLTAFDGISFEGGKRKDDQVRSLLNHIRKHIESSSTIHQWFPGLNPELGRKQLVYWTSIGLVQPAGAIERGDAFNKHPHLTIGFEDDQFSAFIVLPNAALLEYKHRAMRADSEEWRRVLIGIVQAVHELAAAETPVPFMKIMQRHWQKRRSPPITDGQVEFSLDTLATPTKLDSGVKDNIAWVEIVPSLIQTFKHANIEVQIGFHYPYERCKTILGSATFPEHLVQAVGTLRPFLKLLTEDPWIARSVVR